MTTKSTPQKKSRTFQQIGAMSALALVGLMSACGSSASPAGTPDVSTPAAGHQVAVVQVAAHTSPRASAPETERPLITDDTTDEERQQMWTTWTDCLVAHGYTGETGKFQKSDVPPAAVAGCASLEPEDQFARSKRLDANFTDELNAWVQCANEHGIKSFARGGDLWLVDGLPSAAKEPAMSACEDAAFGY